MMKSFVKVMKALSDPNRVKMIKMLQTREMCVCEVKDQLGLAQPTISSHLKILEEAGLVERRKERMWVNYRLADNAGSAYAAGMVEKLRDWLEDDPEIKTISMNLLDAGRKKSARKPD